MNSLRLRGATLALAAVALAAAGATTAPARVAEPLALPGATVPGGFDDMAFAPAIDRVLVPGGASGALYAIDPASGAAAKVAQVTAPVEPVGGDDYGTTTAAYADGYYVANDHADRSIVLVAAASGEAIAHAKLASGSDFLRYVPSLGEIWVTEPDARQIEVFDADLSASAPTLTHVATIPVRRGPEGLLIDAADGRAYANDAAGHTMVIGLRARKVIARWPNSCRRSRGLALSAPRRLLFVGCKEGKAVALDIAHGGRVVGTAKTASGVDLIAWSPALGHLYVPGARSGALTILSVSGNGSMHRLARVATAKGAHCAASDGKDEVYVCDPRHGRVLAIRDAAR